MIEKFTWEFLNTWLKDTPVAYMFAFIVFVAFYKFIIPWAWEKWKKTRVKECEAKEETRKDIKIIKETLFAQGTTLAQHTKCLAKLDKKIDGKVPIAECKIRMDSIEKEVDKLTDKVFA